MKPLLVVAGVSGTGKSTIGELLAREFGVPFEDADDLHPESNVRKMARGHPLDDGDRWPWLRRVGEVLAEAKEKDTGLVVACSALRRSHRETILAIEPHARFILLDGKQHLLETRLSGRTGHFMPRSLLGSQLATLEALATDEPGVTVSVKGTPHEVVAAILTAVG